MDKMKQYEDEKAKIAREAQSREEYEKRIRELARRLKI